MLSRLLGSFARAIVLPMGRGLAGMGVTPNMMTVLGTMIVVTGCILVGGGSRSAGGIVILAGAAVDLLDGAVARGGGMTSRAGAFLDSTLDRISDGLIFASIAWAAAMPGVYAVAFGPMPVEKLAVSDAALLGLAFAALFGGFLTSYIKARAEGLGMKCDVGIVERPERLLLVGAGLIFGLTSPALVVLAVLSAITVVQRFIHTWRQAQLPT